MNIPYCTLLPQTAIFTGSTGARSHHIIGIFTAKLQSNIESTVHLGLNIGRPADPVHCSPPARSGNHYQKVSLPPSDATYLAIIYQKPCISFSTVCLPVYTRPDRHTEASHRALLNLLCLIFTGTIIPSA